MAAPAAWWHRFSVAPMMQWTDRHYRHMARMLSRRAVLYTEMVVDETILHQQDNLRRFLGHNSEPDMVLQLGGSEPDRVAAAAQLANQFGGYREINLNVGCPSSKVQKGCFGARLMLEPERVRDVMAEMRRQVDCDVTVKCRIGVDDVASYESLSNFVSTVAESGVTHFMVHARRCILQGLSPADNRRVPPLHYDTVHRLVGDFPQLLFSINGGIQNLTESEAHLAASEAWGAPVHGVMLGRAAYNTSWILHDVDRRIYGEENPGLSRREVLARYADYCDAATDDPEEHASPMVLVKPTFGLFGSVAHGKPYKRAIANTWAATKRGATARELIEAGVAAVPDELLDSWEFGTPEGW